MEALWTVLMIATHLIINGHSRQTQIAGTLGHNVTLQFTLNTSITNSSHFAVYFGSTKKVAEYCPWESGCLNDRGFDVYAENYSVFCQITNLTRGHSGTYRASLFPKSRPPEESNEVHLIVQEKSNNTISDQQEYRKTSKSPPSIFSSVTLTVLVVLPFVLLVATLPWFFWCCARARAKRAQQNSSPSIQVASVASNNMPEDDFTYSVLDFPKRDTTRLDSKTNDTEYVRVQHLTAGHRLSTGL
ncbi:uncharacterized protein LOC144062727 [Vanacampus margaritifer]